MFRVALLAIAVVLFVWLVVSPPAPLSALALTVGMVLLVLAAVMHEEPSGVGR